MSDSKTPSNESMSPLWIVAGLVGLANAGWAAFQWQQLLIARSGGVAFCPLGDGTQCSQIWDSGFAAAVQAHTVLPVAAWGVVWGLAAGGLALGAGFRGEPFRTSAIVTAVAGLVAIVVLAGASLQSGGICSTCAITYGGVLVYAGVVLVGTRPWDALAIGPGIGVAAGATALAYALAFFPSADTPASPGDRMQELVAGQEADPAGTAGSRKLVLERYVTQLRPDEKQLFSNLLDAYQEMAPKAVPMPRALKGPANAPIRITDWLDPLCSHCRNFHETVGALMGAVPADAFSVDTRLFPLDFDCNPGMTPPSRYPIRCEVSRGIICMESSKDHFAFTGDVLKSQATMDRPKLLSIAEKYGSRETFEACLSAPETAEKLANDIAAAETFDIRGTPLVVINGRGTLAWGPFLYAMILANGDVEHPAFAGLPAPNEDGPPIPGRDAHAH